MSREGRCQACGSRDADATTCTVPFTLACGVSAAARVPARACRSCGAVRVAAEVAARARLAVARELADQGVQTGEVFRHMRKALGIRAADLARLLDVTPETISHWETGKSSPARGAFAALAALVHDALEGRSTTRDRLAAMADGRGWPSAILVDVPSPRRR